MSVHVFPPGAAHPEELPAGAGAAEDDGAEFDTCTIWWIRARLGRRAYGDRRLVRFVALLIADEGFPPPLPALRGQRLDKSVTTASVWIRSAVEAWLADWLPPASAAALDAAACRQAAAEMDEAAATLRLIDGGRE